MFWSGRASWSLISSASEPPTTKKANEVIPYKIPIFLWSTVVNQLQKPVVAVGRASRPRPLPPPAGTLTLAIDPPSLEGEQVRRDGVDLLRGQAVVRHPRARLDRRRVVEPLLQVLLVRRHHAAGEARPRREVREVRSAVLDNRIPVRVLDALDRVTLDARTVHERVQTSRRERGGLRHGSIGLLAADPRGEIVRRLCDDSKLHVRVGQAAELLALTRVGPRMVRL